TVINVSASQQSEAFALGVSRPGRSAVVVNGIDVDELDQRTAWGRGALGFLANSLVLGCVGRVDPVKRHRVRLGALRRMSPSRPRVRLLLVGDGPARDR